MAVRVRYYGVELIYTRASRWSGNDALIVECLNATRPHPIAPYAPNVTVAELELLAEFGPEGWEIISYDDEPIDPNVVY